jgi:hypothetical protein
MNNLASVLSHQGKYQEAEESFESSKNSILWALTTILTVVRESDCVGIATGLVALMVPSNNDFRMLKKAEAMYQRAPPSSIPYCQICSSCTDAQPFDAHLCMQKPRS